MFALLCYDMSNALEVEVVESEGESERRMWGNGRKKAAFMSEGFRGRRYIGSCDCDLCREGKCCRRIGTRAGTIPLLRFFLLFWPCIALGSRCAFSAAQGWALVGEVVFVMGFAHVRGVLTYVVGSTLLCM